MAKFINTNSHEVYVDDPENDEQDLTRIYPGEEVSATGAFADKLASTAGMMDTSSDAYDDYKDGQDGKLVTEDSDDDEGKVSVDSPEALAVGPDLSSPEPSKEDIEAEEAGVREAEKERQKREAEDAKAAEKAESKSGGSKAKSGGTTTSEKVPAKK